ncbi:MAG: PRC-barrel domain-containing protein [Candidatus Kerfeldbacteria bacterium]|nr:PRC-barrel domain-containing protein [Candidatus Kerfeldbacteria bacterium]
MMPSLTCYNLSVYTKSGRYLGRVVDVEIEASSQQVLFYHVATAISLSNLWRRRLLISPKQILSFSRRALIVEDGTVNDRLVSPSGLAAEPLP